MRIFTLIFILYVSVCVSDSARILTLFPAPTYSHFIIGDILSNELATKGHDVTLVAAFQPKSPPKSLRTIQLKGIKEFLMEQSKLMNFFDDQSSNSFLSSVFLHEFGYGITKYFFEHIEIQQLIKSNEKYDLVILEQFFNEAVLGLCHLFQAPCIIVNAVGSANWNNRLTGNIGLASYIPNKMTNYGPKMSFLERTHNLALSIFQELIFHFLNVPKMNELMHQHLPNTPHLYDLYYRPSLIFLNTHPALGSALATTPNMIDIGGIHVEGLKNVTLPEDVKKFLDKHAEGVIYFALGSNAQSKDMPKNILSEILKAFKKWGKPILWKYEEELPENLDNVMVAKWFPQTAVLAHKNTKAFITHCGRLSSLESIYYGVPMIGIPLFAEQAHNAAEMSYYGLAIALELHKITAENLYYALNEITSNPSYSNEAKMRSKAMHQKNSLNEAIKWIDHVLEFNGASYLRSAGVELPWYQFWMVDVIGFVLISFLGINVILAYVILKCCSRKSATAKNVPKKKKKN